MERNVNKAVPKILLVGVGAFGKNHLKVLQKFENNGEVIIFGAVTLTEESKKNIEKEYGIPVYTQVSPEILRQVDAVDIVTPYPTHFEIAKKCLNYADVIIEKPLASNSVDAENLAQIAEKNNRILMVAHIYRFHPVVKKIKSIISDSNDKPYMIKGSFINPVSNDRGREILLELSHYFDVIDYFFEDAPDIVWTQAKKRVNIVSLRYPNKTDCIFNLGWEDNKKIRTLDLYFSDRTIKCNLHDNKILVIGSDSIKEIPVEMTKEPLEEELSTFLRAIRERNIDYPDGKIGSRIVKIAEKAKLLVNHNRPKVAIIGAGLFGTNCAIEMDKYCDVTIFERNKDIMMEASYVNQYRHHWGYHYPRSVETVKDIRKAIPSFESLYNDAIVRNFPTYYSVAKEGSKTSSKDYLEFCRKNELPFTEEFPDSKYLNRDKIDACIKTFEPIYDFDKLKDMVQGYLSSSKNVKIRVNSNVIGASIEKNGKKKIVISCNDGAKEEYFDYIINTTYGNHNQLCYWLNFHMKPIRIDLVEALVVKLPIPKISLAVMDGPFTNLVPIKHSNTFTLVHIKESIHQRYVPKNGLPDEVINPQSRKKEIMEKSEEWFPILKDAEIIESRYVFRAVNAYREFDDARPSDITNHGFGCWSILGGKIVNCVYIAKELAEEIFSNTNV
ncbi:MAG: FAD-dependent oxidoreductase [Nanoarchaeota archaeon]